MSSFRSISVLGAPRDGKAVIAMASNALNVSTTLAAPLFVGNGAGLTDITMTNATLINADVIGNTTGTSVVATSFVKAPVVYANVEGNVTATFVDAASDIRAGGDAFAARFVGDHVGNLLGNVYATSVDVYGIATAGFFVGNGSFLTGVSATIPPTVTADVVGNVTATFVDATASISTTGDAFAAVFYGDHVGNVTGNVTATFVDATADIRTDGDVLATNLFGNLVGNVTATYVNATANIRTDGNVIASYFVGNGAFLTDIGTIFPTTTSDLFGNVTATFVNATANVRTEGNVIVGNMLSFGSRVQNNLITLNGNADSAATDFFGFGVDSSALRYQAGATSSHHKFLCGAFGVATFSMISGVQPVVRLHPPTPSTQQTTMWYNDGATVYFLNTAAGDPDGLFTTARPLSYALSTGDATLGGDTSFLGNASIAAGRILSLGTSQNCVVNLYPGGTSDPTTTAFYGFGVENGNTLRHQADLGGTHSFLFGTNATAKIYSADDGGWNSASAAMGVAKYGVTGRSVNASGTINASGADYAEYMTKAGDFEIAKGDIIGVNAEGKITNRFADSVTFAIKSTDPSLVGGDSWGFDETIGVAKPGNASVERAPGESVGEHSKRMEAVAAWETALEDARNRVDRVAFSGQVPCNVLGATPGQYIVPRDPGDGSIAGRAVTDPRLADYRRAVGVVVRVLDDGRAFVFVKVG